MLKKIILFFFLGAHIFLVQANVAPSGGFGPSDPFGPTSAPTISDIDKSIPTGTFDINGTEKIATEVVNDTSNTTPSGESAGVGGGGGGAGGGGSGYSPCRYSEGTSLSSFLNGCKPKTVVGAGDMKVEGGFKSKMNQWITNISLFLGVMAVGSLVYAAFLMQISGGEDEQIKKGKNIIKYTILGFLGLIMASGIVYLVINVMFGLGS